MVDWKNILVAVDEMESSLRAVQYVGEIVKFLEGASICLLHIYPEPPPDFYLGGGKLQEYQAQRIQKAERIFSKGIDILIEKGVSRDIVYFTTHMVEGKTISQTLLSVREKGHFGTVVTGKRGVSKSEEFLFGSISNALARNSNDFTTWVVG